MIVEFEVDGQTFTALNGGPLFKFNEALSLQVRCKDQAEVDYYWERLGEHESNASQRTMTEMLKQKSPTSRRCSEPTTAAERKPA